MSAKGSAILRARVKNPEIGVSASRTLVRAALLLFLSLSGVTDRADSAAGAEGVTKIHAAYTLYMRRVTPAGHEWAGKVLNDIFLELSGNNTIRETFKEAGGGSTRRERTDEGALGAVHWRVAGPHRLQMVDVYPQNVVTITIDVNGQSCKVLWTSKLRQGYTDHLLPSMTFHDLEHYADPHMVDSICTITKGDRD